MTSDIFDPRYGAILVVSRAVHDVMICSMAEAPDRVPQKTFKNGYVAPGKSRRKKGKR